jgi:hypothetical protein
MFKRSLLLIVLIATAGYAEDAWRGHQPTLTPQHSGTTQLLIAVSPVNSRVIWAAEPEVHTSLRLMAARPGNPG